MLDVNCWSHGSPPKLVSNVLLTLLRQWWKYVNIRRILHICSDFDKNSARITLGLKLVLIEEEARFLCLS